jgi:lipoprotein NlpD
MLGLTTRSGSVLVCVLLGILLSACGTKVINRAPVEDRGTAVTQAVPVPVAPTPPVVQPVPSLENADKAGYYTVKPGDTLIRIGLEHGQSARDIARWSGVENPNRIEVGQVLRVLPPIGTVVSTPVTTASATPMTEAAAARASSDKRAAPVAAASSGLSSTQATGVASEDDVSWIWPTLGAVLAGFDEVKNKGLDIGGAAGDPVLAAADGRVVYVGAGLRGYGNLIILKHNNTFLTAYAHNSALLIKEDQSVRQGQKIAEMGSSDSDRVKLHFEIRRQGKPVDPAKYLPAR